MLPNANDIGYSKPLIPKAKSKGRSWHYVAGVLCLLFAVFALATIARRSSDVELEAAVAAYTPSKNDGDAVKAEFPSIHSLTGQGGAPENIAATMSYRYCTEENPAGKGGRGCFEQKFRHKDFDKNKAKVAAAKCDSQLQEVVVIIGKEYFQSKSKLDNWNNLVANKDFGDSLSRVTCEEYAPEAEPLAVTGSKGSVSLAKMQELMGQTRCTPIQITNAANKIVAGLGQNGIKDLRNENNKCNKNPKKYCWELKHKCMDAIGSIRLFTKTDQNPIVFDIIDDHL